MNKATGSKSTYRGLGSIDIQATARSVLLVARLRDKPNIRIMAHDKSFLAPTGDAIGFEMSEDRGMICIGPYDITIDELLMGNTSYTAHISNKKSTITSKSKLLGVAKHNLRKYKSDDYSKDNIMVLRGTDDLLQDVKNVYHQEFDEVIKEYNEKQKRADRKIDDYFEHVAGLEQDMAVEIIFQCGDKEFWKAHDDVNDKMYYVYSFLIGKLEELLPEFKIANAVIHFDEASPHVHVVGVPVWEGAKKGLRKKVSKRNVFTPETLSVILPDKLREEAGMCFRYHTHEDLSEKSLGRNHDLSVTEYKVAKETEHLEQIKEQVHDADIELLASQIAYKELERRQTKELNEKTDAIVKKNEAMEQEYTDKKDKLECEISYLESKRNIEKSLSDMDKRESQRISNELEGKRLELQSVNQEIEYTTDKAKETVVLLDRIKAFVSSFRLFAPTIEEYANQVEADKTIDAGNSFRGILYEIGKLLEAFKELIKEGLCCFPRLMRWNTSKGEVAPVFGDTSMRNQSGILNILCCWKQLWQMALIKEEWRWNRYQDI